MRRNFDFINLGGQAEPDLPPAGQLDIDLRQQLGVEQRAVPGAVAAVDAIAGAQRVERILGPGMARTGQRHGIDHPLTAKRWQPAHLKLGIDEAEVEPGIVRDQLGLVAQKLEQSGNFLVKARFVGQERD